jgi:hypothetical protein
MKLAIVFVAALLLLTACRDSDEEILADACTELDEMQQALDALEALDTNSTVDQVEEVTDNARLQTREAAQAVRRVQNVRWEELSEAQSDLGDAVQNLDDGDSVTEAKAQLQPYVQQVLAARQNLSTSLNCP